MCLSHSHSHTHTHSHSHSHNSAAESDIHEVAMEENLLKANDDLAESNRLLFRQHDITTYDFMGSIGSGKTTLIGKITKKLKTRYKIAILNGDATTVDDFDESAIGDTQLLQISTRGECHLDANMVNNALGSLDLHQVDLMFIENVGNLVCPADFPLGSKSRVVVVSVSEGPYTVRKHTQMFLGAEIAVINKMDIAGVMGVDVERLISDIKTVNPGTKVVTTSCRTGEGIDEFLELLLAPSLIDKLDA